MADDVSKYPWWARSTGGNRGWTVTLAIIYTLLGVLNGAVWSTGSGWWSGVVSVVFLLLAIWEWAIVVYLNSRSDEGRRRGW
ncbi:hypothetical protein ACF1AJ_07670 [Leifsonia sp. NPDC014704]|uniref:hypothetical protein n=1 Tax=Leifsonia sp. NPDC014704 TaxID=3364123 RepID=UPI0036F48E42